MGRRGATSIAASLLLISWITACGSGSGTTGSSSSASASAAIGQLHIVATLAPTCPVERIGAPPCTAPYQGRIAILTTAGTPVTELTTSSIGTADVSLPAGTYTVGTPSSASKLPRLSQPVTVTVISGSSVTATLNFDTGIR